MLGLEDQIIVSLRQIAQAIDIYSRFLLNEFGLSAPQIATLQVLQSRESATPTELAELLHTSPPTMAGILQRLEVKKLVERQRDSPDRRIVSIRISLAGREAVQNAPPLLRDKFRSQLARLQPWERTQVLATLQRVASMMQADDMELEPFLFHESVSALPATPRDPADKDAHRLTDSLDTPDSSEGVCPTLTGSQK